LGDPKFSRRKYDTPAHPWEGERIRQESELVAKYGLKNKRELWKAQSLVRGFRAQSRDLQARLRTGDKQAAIETEQLLKRLARLGLLPEEGGTLNDVLALNTEDILARRLQTLTFQRGFANTPRQARQFITHGHLSVAGRRVTIPGYIIKRREQDAIAYQPASPLAHDLHPARPKPTAEAAALAEAAAAPAEVPAEAVAALPHEVLKVAKPKLERLIKEELEVEGEDVLKAVEAAEPAEPEPEPKAEAPEKPAHPPAAAERKKEKERPAAEPERKPKRAPKEKQKEAE